jgi:hypothetical protein
VGYSSTQSAYHCLDPTTNKIYTSTHVKFVESIFPYTQLTSTYTPSYPDPSNWCQINLPLLSPAIRPQQSNHEPTTSHDTTYLPPSSSNSPSQVPNTSSISNPILPNPNTSLPSNTNNPTDAPNHSMVTRSKNHIFKTNKKFVNHTTTQFNSSVPLTVKEALKDPL